MKKSSYTRILPLVLIQSILLASCGGGAVTPETDATDITSTATDHTSENDYTPPEKSFGGQNVNEVLSAAAQRPTEKFQYLPYNPYAQTAYGDEVSKAYSGDITLEKALENYANKLAEQGKQQGYNVTVK